MRCNMSAIREVNMEIDDIKDKELKQLVQNVSSMIGKTVQNALEESSDDEELITTLQSKLDEISKEVSYYYSKLEQLKFKEKGFEIKKSSKQEDYIDTYASEPDRKEGL